MIKNQAADRIDIFVNQISNIKLTTTEMNQIIRNLQNEMNMKRHLISCAACGYRRFENHFKYFKLNLEDLSLLILQ